MPFFFTYQKTNRLTNSESLELNKSIARDLIDNSKWITSLNPLEKVEINSDDEFSEFHFQLEYDDDENLFIRNFLQNQIDFEIGGGQNPVSLQTKVNFSGS